MHEIINQKLLQKCLYHQQFISQSPLIKLKLNNRPKCQIPRYKHNPPERRIEIKLNFIKNQSQHLNQIERKSKGQLTLGRRSEA